jgi:hypothetical protein
VTAGGDCVKQEAKTADEPKFNHGNRQVSYSNVFAPDDVIYLLKFCGW